MTIDTTNRKQLTEQHSFIKDSIFKIKTWVLTVKRMVTNGISGVPEFTDTGQWKELPVISFSESKLWNPNDNKDNWILTAGKIENLRIACKQLNGIEVKANQIFSFWKHIGNPNWGKGYVVGREIREGCIVPTKAGGLCQLINALYDAAQKAGFEIVERHRHTKVIKGSLAEQDRDATVKWNYVDLRFRSSHNFRIEIELTVDKLILKIRSSEKNKTDNPEIVHRHAAKLNDCYSCGNFACFKHPDRTAIQQDIGTTTYLLDANWPEYNNYINTVVTETDHVITTIKPNRFLNITRYQWQIPITKRKYYTQNAGIYRALALRLAAKRGKNVFKLGLQTDARIAKAAVAYIPIESTHLVIQQNLLPFVYASGALGGRTYDVLMTRLPMEILQQRLDEAYEQHPQSTTLADFRVPDDLVALENKALTQARYIITPHTDIGRIFSHKVKLLPWVFPKLKKCYTPQCKTILFPASAVGRKGAFEVRELAAQLKLTVMVTGTATEYPDFWKGVTVKPFNGDFTSIAMVVYPAYVEHCPRMLLKALAAGIPVVASTTCGLAPTQGLHLISSGDYSALEKVVKNLLIPVGELV